MKNNVTIAIGNKTLVKAVTTFIYIKIALEIIGFVLAILALLWFWFNNY